VKQKQNWLRIAAESIVNISLALYWKCFNILKFFYGNLTSYFIVDILILFKCKHSIFVNLGHWSSVQASTSRASLPPRNRARITPWGTPSLWRGSSWATWTDKRAWYWKRRNKRYSLRRKLYRCLEVRSAFFWLTSAGVTCYHSVTTPDNDVFCVVKTFDNIWQNLFHVLNTKY